MTDNLYVLPANRIRTSEDARQIPFHWQRSDSLVQNTVLHPDTVRACMEKLAMKGGSLAFTPEMQARLETVLQQRFESDKGNDMFEMPNYGPYEDQELAAFYGVDTTETNNIQTRKETFKERRDRLIKETVREVEVELPGLAQMMEHFRREDWARHGVADEAPFFHSDPDITLLRNPGRGWNTLDRPISTSDKSNVIDMFEGEPEYTFPTPHPGWDIDRRGGYFNSLS